MRAWGFWFWVEGLGLSASVGVKGFGLKVHGWVEAFGVQIVVNAKVQRIVNYYHNWTGKRAP